MAQVKKPSIRAIIGAAGDAAASVATRGLLQAWLQQNSGGGGLIASLQAGNIPDAVWKLESLCVAFALARPIVDGLMCGTPEEAIRAIAEFDHDFADRLRLHVEALGKLQLAWRGGR